MSDEERNIILVGLGKFGNITVNLFKELLSERKHQISVDVLKNINIYSTVFETDIPFNYSALANKINDCVKDSRARIYGSRFSYIFIGDLYDIGTSTYAIDFAFLPSTIELAGSLSKKDVFGFFTYASDYGVTQQANEKAMASILNYFNNMESIDKANEYVVPYKDPNGYDFKHISSPRGPFDRNYIVITPGGQDNVDKYTSKVFAERIFYELFYLSPIFERVETNALGSREDGKLFSTFSMMQISRLEDLQHYYLKYVREDQISDYLLAPPITGSDVSYYEEYFLKLIDIPLDKEFPIERAVKLFMSQNKDTFTNILEVYRSNKTEDFNDYIQTCKNNINERLKDISPKCTEFVRNEIDFMLNTLDKGFENLFNINRLTGNINTYIAYIEQLRERFVYWEESLNKIIEETEDISFDKEYEKNKKKIENYQNNIIYKLPIFIPIRRKILENIILNMPVEEYIKNIIKKHIARAFLMYWTDTSTASRNPVKDCNKLIKGLNEIKDLMIEKKSHIKEKINLISEIPSYYYVNSQMNIDEYKVLLQQIKDEYFGINKKSDLEIQAKEFFKKWAENKNIYEITNSYNFIRFFDEFIEDKTVIAMNSIDLRSDTEEYCKWAQSAVDGMEKTTKQLTQISFKINSNSIENEKIVLNPDRKKDQLSEKLKNKMIELQRVKEIVVPREFTVGSIVYFQDYLWMEKYDFKQYENLKKYENIDVIAPVYSQSLFKDIKNEEPIVREVKTEDYENKEDIFLSSSSDNLPTEKEMTIINKYTRFVLNDYVKPDFIKLYKEKFDEDVEGSLSDGQLRRLTKIMDFKEILGNLSDKDLHDFSKEINCPVVPDKDRQIEVILKILEERERK